MKGRLVLVCVLAVLAASCAGGNEVSGDRRVVGGVAVAFSVRPARVEAGTAVRMTLRLNNVTGTSAELTFPTSQQYDFWVMRGDDEVWRWSDDRMFTPAVDKTRIGPQETLTLSESWVAEGSGTYVVHGEVKADGYGRDLTGELRVGA